MNPAAPQPNRVRSFLFEQLDIRGAWVQLGTDWREMIAGRQYAEPVLELLGQLAVVTTLVTANLKQAGRLTFQLRGDGAVSLLVMDCDEQLRLRGMARATPDVLIGGFAVDRREPSRFTVVAALDNLAKGAATQAMQNLNLAFGFDELDSIPQETTA